MDIINFLNLLLARIPRNRKIKFNQPVVKVNIGSGLHVYEGWINLDCAIHALVSKLPVTLVKIFYGLSGVKKRFSYKQYIRLLKKNSFIYHNVEYGLPFNDFCVDYIYSCHFLEHLNKQDGIQLLKEVYRVLKTNGLLRLCVPDFEHAVLNYNKGNKEAAVDFIFASHDSSYLNTHKYMYDFDVLKKILSKIGFSSIEKCSYKNGNMPDIKNLEKYPDTSIFIEAYK